MFEPTLDHNREAYGRVSRQMWRVLGVHFSASLILSYVAPVRWIPFVIVFAIGGVVVLVVTFEFRKYVIGRRDLHERLNKEAASR